MTWNVFKRLLHLWFTIQTQPVGRKQHLKDTPSADIRPETLESRVVPSALTITFDYSQDTNHFFDTPEKKAVLQSVADLYAARISDNLQAITPSGSNKWDAIFTSPGSGAQVTVRNLSVPQDTIVIFVGGRDLDEGTLGVGGPGGYSATGSTTWRATVDRRGQVDAAGSNPTDFGPWGGSITFDSVGTSWYFGSDPPPVASEAYDFMSVAMHELGHVLGFGTSDSFDRLISNRTFLGSKSDVIYDLNGQPMLAEDVSHWAEGTSDAGQEAAMDPDISPGTRKLFTELDWAALDDIGWRTGPVVLPAITFSGPGPKFLRGGSAATLDATATFANPGASKLAGTKLQVAVTSNSGSYDFLSIKTGGGITKSGSSLKFNGVTIGSYSNGFGKTPFKLTFNSKATDAAVQACLRNLTFSTTSRKASVLDRTVTIAFIDPSEGISVSASKLVSLE